MFCPHPACYGAVGGMGLKKGFVHVRLRVGPNSRTWGKKEAEVKFGQVKEVNTLSRLVSGYKQFNQSCMRQRMGIWIACIWPCESPVIWGRVELFNQLINGIERWGISLSITVFQDHRAKFNIDRNKLIPKKLNR